MNTLLELTTEEAAVTGIGLLILFVFIAVGGIFFLSPMIVASKRGHGATAVLMFLMSGSTLGPALAFGFFFVIAAIAVPTQGNIIMAISVGGISLMVYGFFMWWACSLYDKRKEHKALIAQARRPRARPMQQPMQHGPPQPQPPQAPRRRRRMQ